MHLTEEAVNTDTYTADASAIDAVAHDLAQEFGPGLIDRDLAEEAKRKALLRCRRRAVTEKQTVWHLWGSPYNRKLMMITDPVDTELCFLADYSCVYLLQTPLIRGLILSMVVEVSPDGHAFLGRYASSGCGDIAGGGEVLHDPCYQPTPDNSSLCAAV